MKRLLSLLLSLSLAASLAACTSASSSAPSEPSGTDTSAAVSSVDPPAAASSAADAAPEESTAPEESAAESSAQPDESVAAEPVSQEANTQDPAVTGEVQVQLTKEEGTVNADDGSVLATFSYQQPTVTLPDAAAQEAVQDDLNAQIQEFLNYMHGDLADYARDALTAYQEMEADGSGEGAYPFEPYYGELNFTVQRGDSAVLSLVVDDIGYSGGAHGWDNRYALNYDAKTGQRLTFAMLGEGFREKANELVLAQADARKDELDESYASQLPFVVSDGTESVDEVNRQVYPELYEGEDASEPEEENLSAEFYLNREGVVFIAGEYVMKAYAGGILEFTVPYESFDGVIAEEYLPH